MDYLESFQASLYAKDWLNRTGSTRFSDFIDLSSFVDYFLLVELTKNPGEQQQGSEAPPPPFSPLVGTWTSMATCLAVTLMYRWVSGIDLHA